MTRRARAGHANATRRDRDHYVTPYAVITPLLEEIWRPLVLTAGTDTLHALDPGAGDGIITRALADTFTARGAGGAGVTAVELDPIKRESLERMSGARQVTIGDFLSPLVRATLTVNGPQPFDLVVANPPYSLAEPFVVRALELVNVRHGIVAMLLNTHIFGSIKRLEFWRANPPAATRWLVPRPTFTGDSGSDAAEYGWIVWAPASMGLAPFGWYHWREAGHR